MYGIKNIKISNMNIKIRQYRDTDLAEVMAAWESASKVAHPFMNKDFFEQERHNIPSLYLPNADTWVVIDENKVVGFIALIGNEIGGLFVDVNSHRKGFGRALMNKAEQIHGDLQVKVFKQNIIGRKFYQSYGFAFDSELTWPATGDIIYKLNYLTQ